MASREYDVESDVSINPDRLDREWVRQPDVFFHYASELADLRHRADQAKNAMEVTWAEESLNARRRPSDYGLDRVTDETIKAAAMASSRYQAAVAAHLTATKQVGYLAALVSALDHKRRALENLVQLEAQHYHSEPRVRTEEAREYRRESGERLAFRAQKKNPKA